MNQTQSYFPSTWICESARCVVSIVTLNEHISVLKLVSQITLWRLLHNSIHLISAVCTFHPRLGSAQVVYLVRYGKGAGSSWHVLLDIIDMAAGSPPDCAVVGRLTQGIAKVVSGVKEERWSFFQHHFIAARWAFLLISCCVHLFSSDAFRWKYVGNGKLVHFCVWMAVTPGVWVSWPTGRRGEKLPFRGKTNAVASITIRTNRYLHVCFRCFEIVAQLCKSSRSYEKIRSWFSVLDKENFLGVRNVLPNGCERCAFRVNLFFFFKNSCF